MFTLQSLTHFPRNHIFPTWSPVFFFPTYSSRYHYYYYFQECISARQMSGGHRWGLGDSKSIQIPSTFLSKLTDSSNAVLSNFFSDFQRIQSRVFGTVPTSWWTQFYLHAPYLSQLVFLLFLALFHFNSPFAIWPVLFLFKTFIIAIIAMIWRIVYCH